MIPNFLLKRFGEPITDKTTISFECQQCGECCQHRTNNPITLTGYDLFRLAQFTKSETTLSLFEQDKVLLECGDYENPLCFLATDVTGSCVFAENGSCSVHKAKPAVCALFPFGRIYSVLDGKYSYILPRGNICNGTGKGLSIPAKQWLSDASIIEEESCYAAYEAAYSEIVLSLQKTKRCFRKSLFHFIFWALFCNYDIHQDYITQLELNTEALRPLLEEAKSKR